MATVRDIAIIILAFESFVIGVALIFLTWQLYRLVKLLEQEIKPLVASLQDTAQTVQGTAHFVNESVVTPTVKVTAAAAAAKQTVRFLWKTKMGFARKGKEEVA